MIPQQTEIENFDSHLQALSTAFVNSVELAENTEERIRGESQQQLESNNKTIIKLQSKTEASNTTSTELKKKLEEIENKISAKDETIKQLTTATISTEKIA